MADTILREYRSSDIPELTALWEKTFGDSEELIDGFFRLLPGMGSAVVAEYGGQLAGSAYVITGLGLRGLPGKAPIGGYIYAVAVRESFRHNGIGSALVKTAAEKARELGADFVCTLPAEKSLYKWYKDILGVETALHISSFVVRSAPNYTCSKLSSAGYMLRREALLRERVRMCPSDTALEFTRILCESYGGGLYACGSGICAAYLDNGICVIRELICADESECDRVAASVGAFLGAELCEYRLPSIEGEPYLAAQLGFLTSDCVWDLTFD